MAVALAPKCTAVSACMIDVPLFGHFLTTVFYVRLRKLVVRLLALTRPVTTASPMAA